MYSPPRVFHRHSGMQANEHGQYQKSTYNRISLHFRAARTCMRYVHFPLVQPELSSYRDGVQRVHRQCGSGGKNRKCAEDVCADSEFFACLRYSKSRHASGLPADCRAGLFTLIYILSRAAGKIGGAFLGGKLTKAAPTVTKYLGFTLLPHSGVSLVFTGIAVSTLSGFDPSSESVISGTVAACGDYK